MELLKLKVDHHAFFLIPFFSPICRFMLKIIEFTPKLLPFRINIGDVERCGGANDEGVER